MKLRHAAALAVVGWYLMVPPSKVAGRLLVDLDAPLSKWTEPNTIHTGGPCHQIEKDLLGANVT